MTRIVCKPGCNCGRHNRKDHALIRSKNKFKCPDCKKYKSIEEWYIRRGGKRSPVCKECHAADGRARRLKTLFSLTIKEYDKILTHQKGVCAICKKPPKTRKLAVDHNHKTGLVRGLVCWRCNSALGKFDDDPVLIEQALTYLINPPATEALGEERIGRTGKVKRRSLKRK